MVQERASERNIVMGIEKGRKGNRFTWTNVLADGVG